MQKPIEEYAKFQNAYDYFNIELYGGRLPPALITLPRTRARAGGYFLNRSFIARNNATLRTDEIALNPKAFVSRNDKEILSILVHEMTHLWQAHEGKPGRNGYHNRQWAREMTRVGLLPISLDNPGKMTGQRVTHSIVPGSPFDEAADRLLATGFHLRWQAAFASVPSENGVPFQMLPKPSRNKVKYTCPSCGLNVWGKADAHLLCGHCTDTRSVRRNTTLVQLLQTPQR